MTSREIDERIQYELSRRAQAATRTGSRAALEEWDSCPARAQWEIALQLAVANERAALRESPVAPTSNWDRLLGDVVAYLNNPNVPANYRVQFVKALRDLT